MQLTSVHVPTITEQSDFQTIPTGHGHMFHNTIKSFLRVMMVKLSLHYAKQVMPKTGTQRKEVRLSLFFLTNMLVIQAKTWEIVALKENRSGMF